MTQIPKDAAWPELPLAAWQDAYATLRLWTQIIGKVRFELTPFLNHSWSVTLYVTVRGLGTGPIPLDGRDLSIDFDFLDHVLWLRTSDGHVRQIMLRPISVAEFYGEVMEALAALGVTVRIDEMPNEIENAVPFSQDHANTSYDRDFATRHFRILAANARVFAHFRTGFLGKASPVHFFWGSFDLAVTRFSGRPAPLLTTSATPGLSACGRARSLFARSVQRRLLAGRRADRLSGVLFLRLSGARGFRRGQSASRRGVLFRRLWPVHFALRRGAPSGRSGSRIDGVFAIDL